MSSRHVSYFDLFTTGVGYLNKVEEQGVENGLTVLNVEINALNGRAGNVKKTRFNATVSGAQAHEWARFLAPDVDQDKNVLIRFRLSGLENPNDQEKGVGLKTKLIGVDWARVDGHAVHLDRSNQRAREQFEGID